MRRRHRKPVSAPARVACDPGQARIVTGVNVSSPLPIAAVLHGDEPEAVCRGRNGSPRSNLTVCGSPGLTCVRGYVDMTLRAMIAADDRRKPVAVCGGGNTRPLLSVVAVVCVRFLAAFLMRHRKRAVNRKHREHREHCSSVHHLPHSVPRDGHPSSGSWPGSCKKGGPKGIGKKNIGGPFFVKVLKRRSNLNPGGALHRRSHGARPHGDAGYIEDAAGRRRFVG